MDKIMAVAAKEFKDGFRNRWIIAITLVFAACSLGLSYFGSAASGTLGFASLESTMISLASLAVILIPLIALMLSYHAFVGEYEQGTMLLLLTYPISRIQMLIGKFIGQGAILTLSSLAGFGTAALAIIVTNEVDGSAVLAAFGWFIVSAALLGWVFIAIAYVISLSVSEKSRAAGLALVVWFLFVLAFDLALLVLLISSEGDVNAQVLNNLLLLNPGDVFRLINYQLVGASEYGGVLQIAQTAPLGLPALFAIMLAWVLIPLAIAGTIFHKREI